MKDSLFQYWERLSPREKLACLAAACTLLLYATYALVLENSMRDAMNKSIRLTRLNAEYEGLRADPQRGEELKGGLTALTLELEKKRGEERRLFAEGVQSRRPVETLLHELRQTAGSMPLQLVDMDVKNGMVSKTSEFAPGSPPGAATGNFPKAIRTETVNYTVSKIVLSYRSGYADALGYFLKVMDLPYAISVNTLEMERSNVSEMGVGGTIRHIGEVGVRDGEMPLLNTKLGIEIIYR